MRRSAAALLTLAILGLPAAAGAFENDLQLYMLGNPEAIRKDGETLAADPLAQERFARFVGELGLAISPAPSALIASVGDAGFSLSFTGDIAFIHGDEKVGSTDVWPTEKPGPGALFLPTLRLRKGLPFSIELGGDVTYIAFSSMIAGTGVAKWTIVEGFQWWPDIGVRAFATGLIGGGALNMIVAGWDVGGSYRFPVGGGAEIGLYGGYQRLGMNASTNNIDFNPAGEEATNPIADDTVFRELGIGPFYDPTTAFSRVYFGGQARIGVLVLGADFAHGSGELPIFTGSSTIVNVALWKMSARLGVQF